MKLLFKQRLFSWFDSYDIYNEQGAVVYVVKGQLAWGHKLEIYDPSGNHLGTVKEEIFSFLPRFSIYEGNRNIGFIKKNLSLFVDKYVLDCFNWRVEGDFWGWEYRVTDDNGGCIMEASKQIFKLTDTYIIDIANPEHALYSLMIVLAIDAAKCSSNGG